VKKMAYREIRRNLRHSIDSVAQTLHHASRTFSHQLVNELQRLNSARMGGGELSLLTPRDRVRAVKTALVQHHERKPRCC
jgi:hypothetical protein